MRDPEQALKDQIDAAFSRVPYPGDDAITEHGCDECDRLAEIFRGKTWRDCLADPEAVLRSKGLLLGYPSLFSPPAFAHYLPFFLHVILDLRRERWVPAASILRCLATSGQPSLIQSYLIRIDALDDGQVEAVDAFLRHLADSKDDAKAALRARECLRLARGPRASRAAALEALPVEKRVHLERGPAFEAAKDCARRLGAALRPRLPESSVERIDWALRLEDWDSILVEIGGAVYNRHVELTPEEAADFEAHGGAGKAHLERLRAFRRT